MNYLDPVLPRGRGVVYALISADDEIVFIANDYEVLTRVLVLQLVAATRPDQYPPQKIEPIRRALSEGDWQGAVGAWMEATGRVVNVYPDEKVWSEPDLDEERFAIELAAAPIFSEPGAS